MEAKKIMMSLLGVALLVVSCSKNSDNDASPQQAIITSDSSEFNGRLKAEVRGVNNGLEANVVVYLFPDYQALINNLSLNYQFTNSSGVADFGYVLQGNYYLLARSTVNNGARDTVVVQVNSRREVVRQMRLTY